MSKIKPHVKEIYFKFPIYLAQNHSFFDITTILTLYTKRTFRINKPLYEFWNLVPWKYALCTQQCNLLALIKYIFLCNIHFGHYRKYNDTISDVCMYIPRIAPSLSIWNLSELNRLENLNVCHKSSLRPCPAVNNWNKIIPIKSQSSFNKKLPLFISLFLFLL